VTLTWIEEAREAVEDKRKQERDRQAVAGEPAHADGGVSLLGGLRNGAWLDEQQFPPLRYVVPGLIPEGSSLLVGPPKAGKSWFTLDVALAVAAGGCALGQLPVGDGRPVLLLALEDGDRRLQERCRALLGPGVRIPPRLDYLTQVQPLHLLATIGEWLAIHGPHGPLVLLDTLGKVKPPAAIGESAYQHDYRVGSALKRAVDAHPGAALITIHHDRKAASEDFVDAVSGTHGLAGAADSIVVLARRRGDSTAVLKVTGRDVVENEYALDLADGAWRLAGHTLDDAAGEALTRRATESISDRSADVLAQVNACPDGVSPSIVATKLGLDGKTVGTYLGRLADAGRVRKVGRGKYFPASTRGVVESVGVLKVDEPLHPRFNGFNTPTPEASDD
jgi:hypothetical protein